MSNTTHPLSTDPNWGLFRLSNPAATPDNKQLPHFTCSDPQYENFLNSYFWRHLTAGPESVYWGTDLPMPGMVDSMWTIEWDGWYLPWIDRNAIGSQPVEMSKPHHFACSSDTDIILTSLARVPVDKHGFVAETLIKPTPYHELWASPPYRWPWPNYTQNPTVKRPTGWDFNSIDEHTVSEWKTSGLEMLPGVPDCCLVGTVRTTHPVLISPEFDCDTLHIPIIEVDLGISGPANTNYLDLIDGFRIYWRSDDQNEFTQDGSVGIDFCSLPPSQFPENYISMVTPGSARFMLSFPMFMHEKWGSEGRRIKQIKIVPLGRNGHGVEVKFNFIRATYDARLTTSNAIMICTTRAMYAWSGNGAFLAHQMVRMRRAMLFMLEHLKGREEGLLNWSWVVGKDGLGGEPGRSTVGSYWDLLPTGRYDLESSVGYYRALLAMADMEDAAKSIHLKIPKSSVIGPDGHREQVYRETPASLRRLADKAKRAFERTFWAKDTGRFIWNIDAKGQKHDFGHLHFNLYALACGLGTTYQRQQILAWLDGARVVNGDTSTGSDIYTWRFAPRTSTKRNEHHYLWTWNGLGTPYGYQMQDGGGVPFTTYFEMIARTREGDQNEVDQAYRRSLQVHDWYKEVSAAGGNGPDVYRTYYNGHPERGTQQGGGPPGGLGLDREFLSDAALGTMAPMAFLGLNARADGTLELAPALPSQLSHLGVINVFWRDMHLTISVSRQSIEIDGIDPNKAGSLFLQIDLRRCSPKIQVVVNGKPAVRHTMHADRHMRISLSALD